MYPDVRPLKRHALQHIIFHSAIVVDPLIVYRKLIKIRYVKCNILNLKKLIYL